MTNTDRRPPDADLVKVLFYPNDDDYTTPETLWAKPLGDDTYRILNSPFFFYGVSFEDTVRAAPASDGMLEFREVVERSGSSTYRIMAREGVEQEQFDSFWQPLSELGCTLERAKGRFYALDVPPGADLDQTTALLANGETAGVWDWEEAHRHEPAKVSLTRPRRRQGDPG